MSSPSVTATISAIDNASPVLREIADLAGKLQQKTKQALSAGGSDAFTASLRNARGPLQQHITSLERIHQLRGAIAGTITGAIAIKGLEELKKVMEDYASFEKKVRGQGIFGIKGESGVQYDDADKARLEAQRTAATALGYKPADTLAAQNVLVQRSFDSPTVVAATGEALKLAKALDITAESASKLLESEVFSSGQEPKTPEQATKIFKHFADMNTVAAKRAAMDSEDTSQFVKFAFPAGQAAGFSDKFMMSEGMTLRRAGIHGDEAGTAVRQQAARTIAPTRQGIEAAIAAGVDPTKYSTSGNVSADALDGVFKRTFGKGLSEAVKTKYDELISTEEGAEKVSSREGYAGVVRQSVEDSGESMSKNDQERTVKAALRQYDLARKDFKGEQFTKDFLTKASDPQIMAYYGPKQGGRMVTVAHNMKQRGTYEDELENGGGFTDKVANERMQGFGAAVDHASASLDVFQKKMAELVGKPLAPVLNKGADLLDKVNKAGPTAQVGAAVGGAVVAGALTYGLGKVAGAVATPIIRKLVGGVVAAEPAAAGATGGALANVGRVAFGAALAPEAIALTAGAAYFAGLEYLEKTYGKNREHQGGTRGASVEKSVWDFDEANPTGTTFWHNSKKIRPEVIDATNEYLKSIDAAPDGATLDTGIQGASATTHVGAVNKDNVWGDKPEAKSGEAASPAASSNITVSGELTGSIPLNQTIHIEPSPLFNARMDGLDNKIAQLKAVVGKDNKGTGMQGDGNATKASAAPAGGH